jgi:dTDP-4-amino-4,6-dideoxygalactose transaminase
MTDLTAGYARHDITPPVGTRLDGFIARQAPSNARGTGLFASTVVIQDPSHGRMAVISLDNIGLPPSHADQLAQTAAQAAGCSQDRVVLAFSHTHSGPVTLPVRGLGGMDHPALDLLRQGIVKSCQAAVQALAPVTVAWSSAPVELGVNRRNDTPDRVMASNFTKPRDKQVTTLFLTPTTPSSRPIVIYCHACHPYCLGPDHLLICADFVGHANLALAAAGFDSAFINGCAGDIMPAKSQLGPQAAHEEGSRLAQAVLQAWETRQPQYNAAAQCVSRTIGLKHKPMPPLETIRQQVQDEVVKVYANPDFGPGSADRTRQAYALWVQELHDAMPNGAPLPDMPGRISVIRVGDGAIVALPGEIFFETGLALAANLGINHAAISAYCHGYTGYAPTPHAHKVGGYEPDVAHKYCTLWALDQTVPQQLIDTATLLWNQLSTTPQTSPQNSRPAILAGTPALPNDNQWPAWPLFTPEDQARLIQALHSGKWGIDSPHTAEFSKRLAQYLGVAHALPVNSGTAALELAVKALGIGPGDEVIVPAYTFVASATSILEMGATPVFADIDLSTLTLCPQSVAKRITPRTRAVILVHFAGNPCDMQALKKAVAGKDIALIEDAAHAHGMLYRGQPAGKLGRVAGYSYQSSKNMAAGEAGALVTDDPALFELAQSFHSFGRKTGRPWYEHHNISWNHRITAFQSAILIGQLDRLEEQTALRFENAAFLDAHLSTIPGQHPQTPGDLHPTTRRAHHIYIWRFDAQVAGISRDLFIKALAAEGVAAFPGYPSPLHQTPMFTEHRYWHHHRPGCAPRPGEPDYTNVSTPMVDQACRQAVWLPQNYLLGTRRQMQGIVEAVSRIVENAPAIQASHV